MPKRPPYVQGGHYHIYNHGANRQAIFFELRNYEYLLRLLKKATANCQVTVVAYALLPNHYHWLLRQDSDIPSGQVPARVFGSYTQAINRAYDRCGTLFEGPTKSYPSEPTPILPASAPTSTSTPCATAWWPRLKNGPTPTTWSGSKSARAPW